MSVLKQMTVTGEVELNRALLTVEYTFVNTQKDSVIPRYVFPVPRGGEITGFQVLNENRQLVRAKLFPWSEESLRADGVCLTQIAPGLYCLQGKGLSEGEESRFLIELFLPLIRRGKEAWLIVPLGMDGGHGSDGVTCQVALTLYVDGKVVSSSHPVECRGNCVSATIQSGRDFKLVVTGERESSFLIRENWYENIGVYRLFSNNPAAYRRERKERVLLLLDTFSATEKRVSFAVRELCFRAIQALPAGTPVQVMLAANPEVPVFPDYVPAGEEAHQTLLSALAGAPTGGSLYELLDCATGNVPEDTLVVLLSGGGTPQTHFEKNPCPIHLVTVGNVMYTPHSCLWRWGEHLHCYPEALPAERITEAVSRWMTPTKNVEIVLQDGVKELLVLPGSDLAVDGYLDLVLCTTRQAPKEFTICQDGVVKETVVVTKGKCMEHLPVTEQIYGRAKLSQLERLLACTDPGSGRAIKQEMERVSLRYGVLSSEAVLAIPQMGGTDASVVEFFLAGSSEFHRSTIFGEESRDVRQKQELVERCLGVLVQNIRADGGIYYGVKDQAEQTAYAALALLRHKEKDRVFAPVIKNCETYLRTRRVSGTAGFLYAHKEELSHRGEVLMCNLPTMEELLNQELTVTVASLILLRLS